MVKKGTKEPIDEREKCHYNSPSGNGQVRIVVVLNARMMFGVIAIFDAIFIVHHLLDERQIGHLDRTYGNISDSSELTAIVQVFVFQAEKVPDESSRMDTQHLTNG